MPCTVLGSTTIIVDTLLVATGTTIGAAIGGGVLALILARTNIPGRALLSQLVTVPLYVTPLLTAIAWSWLGSPTGGLINLFARNALGIDRLIDLQTAAGVILSRCLLMCRCRFC